MLNTLFRDLNLLLAKGSHEPQPFAAALERLVVFFVCGSLFFGLGSCLGDFFLSRKFTLFAIAAVASAGLWQFFFSGAFKISSGVLWFVAFGASMLSYAVCVGDIAGGAELVYCATLFWTISCMFKMRMEIALVPIALCAASALATARGFSDYASLYASGVLAAETSFERGVSSMIGGGVSSPGALAFLMCMSVPYALSAICSKRLQAALVIGAIATFVIFAYAIFYTLSLSAIFCVSANGVASVFIFTRGGAERSRYLKYFSALGVALFVAYFLNIGYACSLGDSTMGGYFSSLISDKIDAIENCISATGFLPNASVSIDGLPSLFAFLGRYGWGLTLLAAVPFVALLLNGIRAMTKIPMEKWDNTKVRFPFEKRRVFEHPKMHKREFLRYESGKTPFDRIMCGASLLSALNFLLLIFFVDDVGSPVCTSVLAVSLAILSRYATMKIRINDGALKFVMKALFASMFFASVAVFLFASEQARLKYVELATAEKSTHYSTVITEKTCKTAESVK